MGKHLTSSSVLPKMAVVRGVREATLAFYNKFSRFEIDYVAPGQRENFKPSLTPLSNNLNFILTTFVPAFGFDPLSLFQNQVNNLSWRYIKGLENVIKNSSIVNISDTYYFFNYQAVQLAQKYHKPVVTVVWTTIAHHISSLLPPYSFITKKVIHGTDLFILRSRCAYQFTDSIGIPREKTIVIYKGVDLLHFCPKKRYDRKFVSILYVGNLHPSKGIVELVCAFEQLVKDKMPVKLLICGDGILKNTIIKKAKTLPITYYGFVTYDKLGRIYQQADIFCSPSKTISLFGVKIWEEYFSYTLMEAQAAGLAIVSTHNCGISEEVDKRNPLVPEGDVLALIKALKTLVQDDKKRNYLKALNRKRAEKMFDAIKQAKKTEDVILKISKTARMYS